MKYKALAECIARADTNIHFINPRTNKIDMKLFTQHHILYHEFDTLTRQIIDI